LIAFEPLAGNGGAGDGAARAFELLAPVRAIAHCRTQAEAVRVGAQGWARSCLCPQAS